MDKLIIKGASTKKTKCWKEFLSNDENKYQLIKLMLHVWQTNLTTSHLTNRSLILSCEEKFSIYIVEMAKIQILIKCWN